MTNEYSISKHRYYELKHFCLQYPEWKKLYSEADGWEKESGKIQSDTTSKDGMTRAELWHRMQLIERTCEDTAYRHWPSLLAYVTGRISVPYPGDRDMFFHCYRMFFWLLDKRRA